MTTPTPSAFDAPTILPASPVPVANTEVEERVIAKIRMRRDAGRNKYGTSMERTDLTRPDWLHHAQEEAMDLAIYLEKLTADAASPAEANRPPIANDPRAPWRFGPAKWTLMCGCAADEHDNRVWCTAHAAQRLGERSAASNAVSDPPATLPWQDAARELAQCASRDGAEELIRRACEQWARSSTEHWRQHDAQMHDVLADLAAQRDCYLASREAYCAERDSLASRRDALRAQLALCRSVLEEARPMVKARLCEMGEHTFKSVDESILSRIEAALNGATPAPVAPKEPLP